MSDIKKIAELEIKMKAEELLLKILRKEADKSLDKINHLYDEIESLKEKVK